MFILWVPFVYLCFLAEFELYMCYGSEILMLWVGAMVVRWDTVDKKRAVMVVLSFWVSVAAGFDNQNREWVFPLSISLCSWSVTLRLSASLSDEPLQACNSTIRMAYISTGCPAGTSSWAEGTRLGTRPGCSSRTAFKHVSSDSMLI
jgi:hypothetical protein